MGGQMRDFGGGRPEGRPYTTLLTCRDTLLRVRRAFSRPVRPEPSRREDESLRIDTKVYAEIRFRAK